MIRCRHPGLILAGFHVLLLHSGTHEHMELLYTESDLLNSVLSTQCGSGSPDSQTEVFPITDC